MKKKYLPIILLLVILPVMSIMFFGCKPKHMAMDWWDYNETTHWHNCTSCNEEVFDKSGHTFEDKNGKKFCSICEAKIPYNDEENYVVWESGLNNSYAYNNDYTFLCSYEEYEDNVLSSKSTYTEQFTPTKYYYENTTESYDDSKLLDTESTKITVKQIDIGGKQRFKEVCEESKNNKIQKSGKYVRSDYIQTIVQNSPRDIICNFDFDKYLNVATYIEFYNLLENEITKYGSIENKDYYFSRDEKGYVSLNVNISYIDDESEYYDDDDYINTYRELQSTYTIADGKLVNLKMLSKDNAKFSNETKNISTNSIWGVVLKYSCDTSNIDSVSMETETTTNECYSKVGFNIGGYYLMYDDRELVDEAYTYAKAKEYLMGSITSFIADTEDFDGMFEIYQDNEMTQVFDQSVITEDRLTLYVKLIPPQDKSMILTINQSRDNLVKFVHVFEIGSTYNFDDILSGYNVLSIDGLDATNKTELLCEENKIYTLIVEAIN